MSTAIYLGLRKELPLKIKIRPWKDILASVPRLSKLFSKSTWLRGEACELFRKTDISTSRFYLKPAENKPQFAQGKKNIESSFKRMHLLNESILLNYNRVLAQKDLWRAIG